MVSAFMRHWHLSLFKKLIEDFEKLVDIFESIMLEKSKFIEKSVTINQKLLAEKVFGSDD